MIHKAGMLVKNVESLLKLTFSISRIFYLMGSILLVDIYMSSRYSLCSGLGEGKNTSY